jgi:regulator of replication initiation timing
VAEILDAARRLEMLLEVPSDDEFDLRELSKICIEENRLPGINETKWLRKVLDKTERIEEQHHDEYTKKTYGLAA